MGCAGREEHTVKNGGQSSSYASDNSLAWRAYYCTTRPTAFSLFRLAFRRPLVRLWQWLMGTPSHMPAFPRALKVGLRLSGKSVGGGLLHLGSVVLPWILLQKRVLSCVGDGIQENTSECAMINFMWHSSAKGHKHEDSYMSVKWGFIKVQHHIWPNWTKPITDTHVLFWAFFTIIWLLCYSNDTIQTG